MGLGTILNPVQTLSDFDNPVEKSTGLFFRLRPQQLAAPANARSERHQLRLQTLIAPVQVINPVDHGFSLSG